MTGAPLYFDIDTAYIWVDRQRIAKTFVLIALLTVAVAAAAR